MPSLYSTLALISLLLTSLAANQANAFPSSGAQLSKTKESSLVHDIAVFPHDNRKELLDTSRPWSTIGRLEIPDGSVCTASLIGPNLIITNAHCVADLPSKKLINGRYLFKAQYRNGKYLAASGVKRIVHGGYKMTSNSRKDDWAILILQKRLGEKLGWLGLFEYENEDLLTITNHYKLYMAGYSTDFGDIQKPLWQGNCGFHANYWGTSVVTHDCSTTNGASGSPMFIFAKDRDGDMMAGLLAIHSGNQFNNNKEITEHGKVVTFDENSANLAVPVSEFIETVRMLRAQED